MSVNSLFARPSDLFDSLVCWNDETSYSEVFCLAPFKNNPKKSRYCSSIRYRAAIFRGDCDNVRANILPSPRREEVFERGNATSSATSRSHRSATGTIFEKTLALIWLGRDFAVLQA